MLWQLQLVLYLNYVLQSPAGFEANLIRLEPAGAFEITFRSSPNGRANTAPRTPGIQMRFAMEMNDRLCPPHLGKGRCLVFELLKEHFCLQDSAMG
jgi:hypothetical protein